MKRILKIFSVLLLFISISLGIFMYRGFLRFKEEIRLVPIKEAVEAYTADPEYVRFENIDEDFIKAVISVEDKRYFERQGYDFVALFRALYHNLLYREFVEGGSTIGEQIAKNLYFESYVEDLEEKFAEIFVMLELEKAYSKEELLALYANMNYYGDGFWGIREAADGYYGKKADDLSLAEAAVLAGIPNAPAIYQLSSGYRLAKERQEWVLKTMYNNGYISKEEMIEAKAEDVKPLAE